MICLLFIMTVILINGIGNAEQKVKYSGTGLIEEEMSAKTKAWLLMVESGKVDEEELRRITPKSIFIAPLLSGRGDKCPEGYRHDHLGQCVKVIKIDPKVQLELLLKRLNKLYTEKQKEDEGLPQVSSSGPLHFSIPISDEDSKVIKTTTKETQPESQVTNKKDPEVQLSPEFIPIPLPMIMLNQTNQTTQNNHTNQTNDTKEFESSGEKPLSNTEPYSTIQLEGSGVASGDAPPEQENTSSIKILSEEADYLDVSETESTTEFQTTTEISTEIITTTASPVEETNLTESYQSITDSPVVNDTVVNFPNEKVLDSDIATNNSNSDIIRFPNDDHDEVRTRTNQPVDNSYIRFPDDTSQPRSSYQSPPPLPKWNSQRHIQPSVIPAQQFWWLPENWKVDENPQKSILVKFWSRLPLIHDVGYSHEVQEDIKKSFSPVQPQGFESLRKNQEFTINLNQQTPTRREKPFRRSRSQEHGQTPYSNY